MIRSRIRRKASMTSLTGLFTIFQRTATSLPEGVKNGAMADGTKHLKNIRGFDGYFGPCAPPGLNHHYTFELYALDTKLDLGPDATRADAMKAIDGHVSRRRRIRYAFQASSVIPASSNRPEAGRAASRLRPAQLLPANGVGQAKGPVDPGPAAEVSVRHSFIIGGRVNSIDWKIPTALLH